MGAAWLPFAAVALTCALVGCERASVSVVIEPRELQLVPSVGGGRVSARIEVTSAEQRPVTMRVSLVGCTCFRAALRGADRSDGAAPDDTPWWRSGEQHSVDVRNGQRFDLEVRTVPGTEAAGQGLGVRFELGDPSATAELRVFCRAKGTLPFVPDPRWLPDTGYQVGVLRLPDGAEPRVVVARGLGEQVWLEPEDARSYRIVVVPDGDGALIRCGREHWVELSIDAGASRQRISLMNLPIPNAELDRLLCDIDPRNGRGRLQLRPADAVVTRVLDEHGAEVGFRQRAGTEHSELWIECGDRLPATATTLPLRIFVDGAMTPLECRARMRSR